MKKLGLIAAWFLPAIIAIIIVIRNIQPDIFSDVNLHIIVVIIGIITLMLNAVIFRPEFGSSRPEGPMPKNQVQRLLHVVITAVLIFIVLKWY